MCCFFYMVVLKNLLAFILMVGIEKQIHIPYPKYLGYIIVIYILKVLLE